MIPILYPAGETAFASNGLGRLRDCISCRVTEERNGSYTCTFVYPISGRHYSDITEGRFISCTHDDDGDRQPFRIVKRTAPINGHVTFYAEHLSYGLANVIVDPFTASGVAEALQGFTEHAINTNPFTFRTDKTTMAAFANSEPSSVRACMGGRQGSILDAYGGEWDFDGWTVWLRAHRGQDSGVVIRYGKNLDDIEQVVDAQGLYNAVVPFWRQESEDGDDVLVTLPEKIVTAEGVENPVPVVLDLTEAFQEQPTEAQLREEAQRQLANGEPWLPSQNIKIDFVALWQTLNFKDAANLQRVRLCDTVDVVYPDLGVTARGVKVIKVVYDVLAEKYTEMELGEARATFADVLTKKTDTAIQKSQATMKGFFDAAIASATDLITGGAGGHVVISRDADGKPQEILIMDTEDINTATNILRINLNGIGFSTNGGQTYSTAWTIDGRFVADFITAGTLKAITIQGPTALTFWNLATGVFQSYGTKTLTSEIKTGQSTTQTVTYAVESKTRLDGGEMTVEGKKTTDSDTTVFTDLGIQSDDVDYDFYEQIPPDVPYTSLTYAHGGVVSRGDRVASYGGRGVDQPAAQVDSIKYNPKSTLTPDYLKLGDADAPIYTDGTAYGKIPDRNILRLSGGWVERREAILFKEYFNYYTNAQGTFKTFYETPITHRVTWDISLHEDLTAESTLCFAWLTASRKRLHIMFPLTRPVGEDVVSFSVQFVLHLMYTATGGTIVSSDQNCWQGSGEIEPHSVEWNDFAMRIIVDKVNGAWTSGSATNNSMVLCEIYDIWLQALDYDPYETT